jgi:hypothetical protein
MRLGVVAKTYGKETENWKLISNVLEIKGERFHYQPIASPAGDSIQLQMLVRGMQEQKKKL